MAWDIPAWLAFTRTFQLLGALVAAGANGFLTAKILTGQLHLTETMLIVQLLVSLPCGINFSPKQLCDTETDNAATRFV